MFGFDGNLDGFEKIIHRIANNKNGEELTHKQVRAYARCFLLISNEIIIGFDGKCEIQILLVALSAYGLPHYDRAFLAKRILKLLEVKPISKNIDEDIPDDDIPF